LLQIIIDKYFSIQRVDCDAPNEEDLMSQYEETSRVSYLYNTCFHFSFLWLRHFVFFIWIVVYFKGHTNNINVISLSSSNNIMQSEKDTRTSDSKYAPTSAKKTCPSAMAV
jgi:hypothetical protein